MGTWKWSGINQKGKRIHGQEEALSERHLRGRLRTRGIRPLQINTPSIFEMDLALWLVKQGLVKPFGNQELINFTKQMSIMISAGIPITQILELLYKQTKNLSLKVAIKRIADKISKGKSLSQALKGEKGFSKLYCNMIKAGEIGGALDIVLEKMVDYFERSEKTKSYIKSAMTYPMIVIIIGIIVVTLMMTFVVPQFVSMLESSGQKIPTITQFVIDTSAFMKKWIIEIILSAFVGIIVFKKWIEQGAGKVFWDEISMNFPIFGDIIKKGSLSRLTRTLSTLLSSGVSLVEALEISSEVVENGIIAKDMLKVKKMVEEGETLAVPLSKIKYIPDILPQMVKVGEQTGSLEKMFDKVSEVFEADIEQGVSIATKMMEPIVLVILGGIVAVILVAMYLPIFKSA